MDLSTFSDAPPDHRLRLLFIHHSCGGQLLAPVGPSKERAPCIYDAHPNGGNLRSMLESAGYEVHEASYGSAIGEATDLFDWAAKFHDHMDAVLRVDEDDRSLPDGLTNQIVLFKSCFPNNDFVGLGTEPGDPRGPTLTVANAKATLRAVREELAKYPRVLFVYVTAPPIAPKPQPERLYKVVAKKLLGRPGAGEQLAERAAWARVFNDWVAAEDGWLAGYPEKNVVVFDYYGVLTEDGASNLSRYATGNGEDSHPSAAGNHRAAERLVPFLNRAVRRAGL
jgi:lysophospholipase L1-like esterase